MRQYIMRHKALTAATLLLSALFSLGNALIALILTDITDVAAGGDMDAFLSLLGRSALFFLGLVALYYVYSRLSKVLICRVTRRLRLDIFTGILRRSVGDFRASNSADYLSAMTNDVRLIEDSYVGPILLVLQQAIVFVASVAVMIYLSPLVTGFMAVAVVLLIVAPSLTGRALQRRQDRYSKALSALTVKIKDLLSGFEIIRAYGMTEHSTADFEGENAGAQSAKLAVDSVAALSEALSTLMGLVVQVGVVFLAAYLMLRGQLTFGGVMGLAVVSGQVVVPIQILSRNIPQILGAKPIIERLTAMANYRDEGFTGTGAPTFDKEIRLETVSFRYGEDGVGAAQNLSARFVRGGKYAVVGKSGCGKTTMTALMTGQYPGFTGQIRYDGRDLRELDVAKVGALSAVIHQNTYMFDASIRENICLHRDVPEAELEEALAVSGVDTFLDGTRGLDDGVGENGSRLSGGQRQRIAVARALVQKKPILILDEGTSAVDRQTACDIERRLLEREDLTLITITHALEPALLAAYDRILYMEDGAVRESGSFNELTAAGAGFTAFCDVGRVGG